MCICMGMYSVLVLELGKFNHSRCYIRLCSFEASACTTRYAQEFNLDLRPTPTQYLHKVFIATSVRRRKENLKYGSVKNRI